MKKILVFTLLLFTMTMTGCFGGEEVNDETYNGENTEINQDVQGEDETTLDESELATMTLEYVSQYNGQDGNRAYIVVDNIVYDVTDSARWQNGMHNDYQAGNDLTDEIENISPHGISVLDRMEKVGVIEE